MRPIISKVLSGAVFLTICAALTAHSASPAADSLSAAPTGHWEQTLAEAAGAGDDYGCREALDRLVQKLAVREPERALEFIRLADSLLPEPRHALFRASLNVCWLWKQMIAANSFEATDHALAKLREKRPGNLTPEELIELEFLTGLSIDYQSIAAEAYGNIPQAIPYVEQALRRLEKYPLDERVHLEKLCREELSDLYSYAEDRRAAGELEKCLDLHRAWLAMDTRPDRPHRDTTEYPMQIYGKMVFLLDLIPREQLTEYYDRCMQLARERNDLEEIYRTSARYYECMGDNLRAAAYVDSVLTHYARTGKKADLGSIYMAQSHMYEKAGDYEKALKAVREGNEYRYHNRMDEAQRHLAEMRTLLNVDRLELEKARLADRSKFFMLVAGAVVVLLLVGWIIYQQAMVRRLERIRKQLTAAHEEAQRQSCRAAESEKMKTAFINSMCHEIRTPLNAINGFSELMLTEEDPEARHLYQEEIRKSTAALTSLLENMLELSKLISTEEPLPVAETDVCLICAERLELQKQLSANPSVAYSFETMEGGGNLRRPNQCGLSDARDRQPAAERRQIHRCGTHHPRLPRRPDKPYAAYQRQRHGHRHPARKAGVGLRTLHQSRSLQTRNGHRALPLPAGNHPPGRRHPRLPRVRGRLLHPHQPALLTPGTSLFAPFRRFFRSGRARWIVFPAEIAIFAP